MSILFRGSSGGAVDSVIPSLLQGLDGSAQQSAQVSSCCLLCWWPPASLCLTCAAAVERYTALHGSSKCRHQPDIVHVSYLLRSMMVLGLSGLSCSYLIHLSVMVVCCQA